MRVWAKLLPRLDNGSYDLDSWIGRLWSAQNQYDRMTADLMPRDSRDLWTNDIVVPMIRALFGTVPMQDYRQACNLLFYGKGVEHRLGDTEFKPYLTRLVGLTMDMCNADPEQYCLLFGCGGPDEAPKQWDKFCLAAKRKGVTLDACEQDVRALFVLDAMGNPKPFQRTFGFWKQWNARLTAIQQGREEAIEEALNQQARLGDAEETEEPEEPRNVVFVVRPKVVKRVDLEDARKNLSADLNEILSQLDRMNLDELEDRRDVLLTTRKIQDQKNDPKALLSLVQDLVSRILSRRVDFLDTPDMPEPVAAAPKPRRSATPSAPPKIRIIEPGYVVDPEPEESNIEFESFNDKKPGAAR